MPSRARRPAFGAFLAVALLAALLGAKAFADDAPKAQGPATPANPTYECPGCLAVVGADLPGCPECGIRFKAIAYQCPKCKNPIERTATSCTHCGTRFDPPTDTRERRSAKAGDLPDVRDFLGKPAPPPAEGPEVHGRSISLWRASRELGDLGGSGYLNRFVQQLAIRVEKLGTRGLSFHADGLARLDVGPSKARPSGENTLEPRLRDAFFRYENDDDSVWLDAGRHYAAIGAYRGFVDGGSAHLRVGDRLGLEAFGGVPVATSTASRRGSYVAGGRLAWRGVPSFLVRTLRDFQVGGSFFDERHRDRPARRQAGFDLSFSPSWYVDVLGHCTWDLLAHGNEVVDARGYFAVRPASGLQLAFDYRFLVPSGQLPKTSMFFTFADDRRHEAEARLAYEPTGRLRLSTGVKVYYVPNPAFRTDGLTTGNRITQRLGPESPYELFGQVIAKHGDDPFLGEFGVEGSLLSRGHRITGATVDYASVLQFRAWERVRYALDAKDVLTGSLELQVEAYNDGIFDDRNHAITGTGTLGFEYDRFLTFVLGGAFRRTPDFSGTGDAFVRVEVVW